VKLLSRNFDEEQHRWAVVGKAKQEDDADKVVHFRCSRQDEN
jgi:hypothetical protein